MTIDRSFEKLFAGLDVMRVGIGIVFGLFLLLFVAVIIEELFLGGRKRRQAEKQARLRQDAPSQTEE
jgi:hypothetical protein